MTEPKHNETFKPQYLYLEDYYENPIKRDDEGEDIIEPEDEERGVIVINIL